MIALVSANFNPRENITGKSRYSIDNFIYVKGTNICIGAICKNSWPDFNNTYALNLSLNQYIPYLGAVSDLIMGNNNFSIDGRVGIGTDTPLYPLEVAGGTKNTIAVFTSTDTSANIFMKDGTTSFPQSIGIGAIGDDLRFFADDSDARTERMRINGTSGNVGIGIDSPSEMLDIQRIGDGAVIRIGESGGAGGRIGIVSETGGNSYLYLGYANDKDLAISPVGNVGIGTTAPTATLHLSATDTSGRSIKLSNSNTNFIMEASSGDARFEHNTWGGDWIFSTRTGPGVLNENVLVVSNTGNVGIGTTSPESLLNLELNDSTAYDPASAVGIVTSDSTMLVLENRDASANAVGTSFALRTNSIAWIGAVNPGNNAADLAFATRNDDPGPPSDVIVEHMRITSAGNVGIGTTSPTQKFEVVDGNSSLKFGFNPDNADLFLDRLSTGKKGQIIYTTAGTPNWYTGVTDSGNAGDGSEFFIGQSDGGANANFWIETNGNVGIGTTDPRGALEIQTAGTGTGLESDDQLMITGGASDEMELKIGVNNAGNYSYIQSTHDGVGHDDLLLQPLGGNVGIGTTSPSDMLHVKKGSAGFIWKTESATGDFIRLYSDGNRVRFLTGAGQRIEFAPEDSLAMTIAIGSNVGIGTASPSYPLEVVGNTIGLNISIYAHGNISATGYITRTSVFDTSKNVWDYIKDSDYYLTDGEIDHQKFYGYAGTSTVTDLSRPETEEYQEEECSEIVIDNETIIDCVNLTKERTIYPYRKTEEGVLLDDEINLLRQAVYELQERIKVLEGGVSTSFSQITKECFYVDEEDGRHYLCPD